METIVLPPFVEAVAGMILLCFVIMAVTWSFACLFDSVKQLVVLVRFHGERSLVIMAAVLSVMALTETCALTAVSGRSSAIIYMNAFLVISDSMLYRPEACRSPNSCISEHWTLSHHHVITGVPENDWRIELRPGQCVDLVPIGESQWAVRPYGYDDLFRGDLTHDDTCFLGMPFRKWAEERRIDISSIKGAADMQTAEIFPVVDNMNDAGLVLRWMLNESYQQGGRMLWNMSRRISADGISNEANLLRLQAQRVENRAKIWPFLARNYRHSVFYQIDLKEAAYEFASANIAQPDPLPDSEPVLTRMHDAMFRSELLRLKGRDGEQEASDRAFALLREGVLGRAQLDGQRPRLSVYNDQIVWARSPVRIDLAGGWTDTPPYCLMEGGSVVNIAVELNGQLPIQAYVKPCREPHVILRSIDLGASETIDSYEQLTDFNKVGSPSSPRLTTEKDIS